MIEKLCISKGPTNAFCRSTDVTVFALPVITFSLIFLVVYVNMEKCHVNTTFEMLTNLPQAIIY
jgi:hypothetical protein